MLLINVVMVKFAERDLIAAKVQSGHLLVETISQVLDRPLRSTDTVPATMDPSSDIHQNLVRLLTKTSFPDATIVDSHGEVIFPAVPYLDTMRLNASLAREAMGTGSVLVNFSGAVWGVIWLSPKEVRISVPLRAEGRIIGGLTLTGPLLPIYRDLRQSEKVILLYILLYTLTLVVAGIHLLSRMVVSPLRRLVRITAEYKGGDAIPSSREQSENEIGRLSNSLHNMILRLDQNKKELEAHIESLEKANKELKKAQNEVIRSEKLASVGRLAAGVAHEIGNPIGIILGYLELLDQDGLSQAERKDFLDRMGSEVSRIHVIIRQLLDFSRPSQGRRTNTNAHRAVMETLEILTPQPMMEDIQVKLALEASRDDVFADPSQLRQVFLNIIMNAADALMEKDRRDTAGVVKTLRIRSRNRPDRIELMFEDNGPGATEEELGHLFDPFYTTKEPGRGTGLGLFVCYRIIEDMGGSIRAESARGRGTRFFVDLLLSQSSN
jgi:signal transduction histidine kinase